MTKMINWDNLIEYLHELDNNLKIVYRSHIWYHKSIEKYKKGYSEVLTYIQYHYNKKVTFIYDEKKEAHVKYETNYADINYDLFMEFLNVMGKIILNDKVDINYKSGFKDAIIAVKIYCGHHNQDW